MLVTLFLHTHNQHSSHRRHSFITILSHLSFTCLYGCFDMALVWYQLCNDIYVLKCFTFAIEVENFECLMQMSQKRIHGNMFVCCINNIFYLFPCSCASAVVIVTWVLRLQQSKNCTPEVVFWLNTGFNIRQAFAWLLIRSRSFSLLTLILILVNVQFVTLTLFHDGYLNVLSNLQCLFKPHMRDWRSCSDRVTHVHMHIHVCLCLYVHTSLKY